MQKKIKPRHPPVRLLKKKVWYWFSLYIRNRDKWTCFTCGRRGKGGEIHAGHFFNAAFGGETWLDEQNVNAQCVGCNLFKEGNKAVYAIKLIDKYGPAILKDLQKKMIKTKKYTPMDLLNLIDYYKNRVY